MKLSKTLAEFNKDMYEHTKVGLFYVVNKLNERLKYLAIEQVDGNILLECRHCVIGECNKVVTLDEFNNNFIFAYSEESF